MASGPLYTEYRIILPYVSLDEVNIGLLYTSCVSSLAETGGGEGVEIITNEQFEKKGEKGQYYHKMLHLASKVPQKIRLLAPRGNVEIKNEIWNSFPKIRSVYMNPEIMQEKFSVVMETLFVDNDKGTQDNVFGLDEEKLKRRKIINIDIVNDPIPSTDYKEDTDPSKVRLEKINRGPLTADWKDTETKFLTVYMFAEIEFIWWGLQENMQKMIQRSLTRIHRNFYRTLICKLDEWYGMTLDDIRALEAKTKLELDESLQELGDLDIYHGRLQELAARF